MMNRTLFLILTLLNSTLCLSQDLTFSQRVNKLFFGVNVSNTSGSLLDSFLSVPQLHHRDNNTRQWNLNVSMEMKSDKAWSSRHEFAFTESPLPGSKIEKGMIEVTLGETYSIKKLLNLDWRLQFSNKASAANYFEKLKELFSGVAVIKNFEHDKDLGDIARFSARNQLDRGVGDISLFLGQSQVTKKYEIALVLGPEFQDE